MCIRDSLESVGKELAQIHNRTHKLKGASSTYDTLVDRKIVIPELGEAKDIRNGGGHEKEDYGAKFEEDAMNDAMANESPSQLEGSLGIDAVDSSYQSDKMTADALLEKQDSQADFEDDAAADGYGDDDDFGGSD
eukprot:TRINITY_DN3454_c0_g1_i2.p1 TRINITY_DN3454_c0_g1~~TRINITY_DN3454_c0_g1_i2.p1  ORF type:complete len:135 (-),score=51.35 TRINITY_DN3454_c0_g1_i2:204-608(-)